ncbi:MAG TPA: GTPase domain-containing protein [Gemmatimonadaceae bacterium]|nr:GTPase domain-containing protein [Gemmatimonadaceae bacterium]
MPIVDHATRLITCKLVFCGPGRSGKTTNLSYLHSALPGDQVGTLTSLATRRDRTLFFDYMPVDLGTVGAYQVRFQLYTVPGQPYYKAIRQLVLQGADGVAFVADSQRHRWDDNLESLQDMHAGLAEHGVDARVLPMVMQYNKQDLPASLVASVDELSTALNFRVRPEFSADALRGVGVFDTLRALGTQVLRRLGADDGGAGGASTRAADGHEAAGAPDASTDAIFPAVTADAPASGATNARVSDAALGRAPWQVTAPAGLAERAYSSAGGTGS